MQLSISSSTVTNFPPSVEFSSEKGTACVRVQSCHKNAYSKDGECMSGLIKCELLGGCIIIKTAHMDSAALPRIEMDAGWVPSARRTACCQSQQYTASFRPKKIETTTAVQAAVQAAVGFTGGEGREDVLRSICFCLKEGNGIVAACHASVLGPDHGSCLAVASAPCRAQRL